MVVILVEQAGVHKLFAKQLAFVNFARHELAAEPVFFVDRFQKIFFYEWFQQFWELGVDTPVVFKLLEESFGQVLEMGPDVEVIYCYGVCAVEV